MTYFSALLITLALVCPAFAAPIIRVVPFVALTSAGNQDLTHADFGGQNVVAATVKLSGGVTPGTIAPHARDSWGWYVPGGAVTQWMIASQGEDAQATTNTDTAAEKGIVAAIQATDRTLMCSMIATSVTNGIKLTQAAGCDQAYMGAVVLFGGTGTQAAIGTFTGAGVIGSSTLVPTPFEPELIFLGKARLSTFVAGGAGSYSTAYGVVYNAPGALPDPKLSVTHVSQNAQATSLSAFRVQNGTFWTLDVKEDDGSFVTHSHFPTSFSVRNDTVANGKEVGYTVLTFGGTAPISLSMIGTPEPQNAGPHALIDPGFTPQFSMLLTTAVANNNATLSAGNATNDIGTSGMALYDGTTIRSFATATEDASASAAMKSLASSTDIRLLSNAGALAWQCDMAHSAVGANLDCSQNPAGTRDWIYLAIGGAGVTTPTTAGRRRIGPVFSP